MNILEDYLKTKDWSLKTNFQKKAHPKGDDNHQNYRWLQKLRGLENLKDPKMKTNQLIRTNQKWRRQSASDFASKVTKWKLSHITLVYDTWCNLSQFKQVWFICCHIELLCIILNHLVWFILHHSVTFIYSRWKY